MHTNIVISLDTRRAKSDKRYPLVMRLGHNGKTTSIPLNMGLFEKDWDEKARIVRKSYKGTESVTRMNNILQQKKAVAMDIIIKLQEANHLQGMSLIELKNRIISQNASASFFKFSNLVIDELKTANKVGTARSYKDVIGVLTSYNNKKDLLFKDITYNFLTKFEANHLNKGNNYNGLAVYLRTVRAIYNRGIKNGIIEREFYPFNDYKIRTVETEKRALELPVLKKIISKKLPQNHVCFNARNYFVASFMLYGMNFTDMAFLKKVNIIGGRIQYRRKKTSKLFDIKITPNLNTILKYYISKSGESPYIFPIIKRKDIFSQYKDIEWARKRYNKKLKLLATLCKIEENLTSYVSRHTFATQAMLQDVPVNAISAMLGHSSIKTTQIYLKSLPNNILDKYNASILK